MTPSYRADIAVYLAAGNHMKPSGRAKSVRQIARELDMSATTVSRWLKANHRDLWLTFWNQVLDPRDQMDQQDPQPLGPHTDAPSA